MTPRAPTLFDWQQALGESRRVHAHVHRDDPQTSRDAAAGALARAPKSCRRIYNYLRANGGRTDEEGQRDLRMFSYPKRRCDLFQAGLVVDGGRRRPSSQGAPMIVWVAR